MPLGVSDVFNRLSEWPHRGVGTEEEMEAREALITELTGEFGVETKEEGFTAPSSYIPFLWVNGFMAIVAIIGANYIPTIMVLLGGLALINLLLFFDGRMSPMIWWGANRTTANLVASKGEGNRLFILMAHIDSAPASLAYKTDSIKHLSLFLYIFFGLIGLGVLLPILTLTGLVLNGVIISSAILLIITILVLSSVHFWQFGCTLGANANLSGVAAATSAASHLWRHMPADTEIRLVVTSAKEAGLLGAQHYYTVHRDELKKRQTYIVNIDTVGCSQLRYVTKGGGLTTVAYDNLLTRTVETLRQVNQQDYGTVAGLRQLHNTDDVWFARAGLPTISITSCDISGVVPQKRTLDDTVEKVDIKTTEKAARLAEAIVRMCPAE